MLPLRTNYSDMSRKEDAAKEKRELMVEYGLSALAVALIVGGFFVPPLGQIDGSVLQGSGIIITVLTINVFSHSMRRKFKVARFSGAGTSIEISKEEGGTESVDIEM